MSEHQNKEWLQARHDEQLSQREIAALAGVSAHTIRTWLKRFGIKSRSISEALCIKPSRHEWTDEDRETQSQKMVEVQAGRKEELSISARKNWELNRDALIAGLTAAANTPERLAKSSEIAKKMWQDHEHAEKIRLASIENWKNPDYRLRHQAATKAACNTPEFIQFWVDYWEEHYDEMIAKMHSPEAIAKRVESYKKTAATPEFKAHKSAASKKLWESEAFRVSVMKALADQPRISSLQLQLYQYLESLGADFDREGPETLIAWYAFDCKVRCGNKTILIECQGDYWHSVPAQVIRDRQKFTYISNYFPDHEVMYLWEHEFKCKEAIINKLSQKLGLTIDQVDFDFSELRIELAEAKEIRGFLDSFHYLQSGRSGINVVAKLNGYIVGAVVYSKPIRNNMGYDYELARLCIHPLYHKHNFATWLIAKSMRFIKPNLKIVAYSDSTVGHVGTVYKASNFKLDHIVEPDYWYVDKDGFVMSKKVMYNHAKKMSSTEAEFAALKGYAKKFGGPKSCYTYTTRK